MAVGQAGPQRLEGRHRPEEVQSHVVAAAADGAGVPDDDVRAVDVGQRCSALGGGEVGDDVGVQHVDDNHFITARTERVDDRSADARGSTGHDRHAASHGLYV